MANPLGARLIAGLIAMSPSSVRRVVMKSWINSERSTEYNSGGVNRWDRILLKRSRILLSGL